MSARVLPALCLGLAAVAVAGVGIGVLRADASTADASVRSPASRDNGLIQPLGTPLPSAAPTASSARPRPATAPGLTTHHTATGPDDVARAVFDALNNARHAAGQRPLRWSPGLAQAAHRHNQAMAAAGVLSHQVGIEAGLATRARDRGINWIAAAENIGWSSNLVVSGALGIEAAMLNEPDGQPNHRANILSVTLNAVGVDVLVDVVHHRLWFTEDFAQV